MRMEKRENDMVDLVADTIEEGEILDYLYGKFLTIWARVRSRERTIRLSLMVSE